MTNSPSPVPSDGKFPTERAQMPALTTLPNLYTVTIPPVNFPKMCLILDHLIPTLSQAIVPGGGGYLGFQVTGIIEGFF